MVIKTKVFGEVTIDDHKIIHFEDGIVGFPDLQDFTLMHNSEKPDAALSWLVSIQEPAFALPVIDPLVVKADYNPQVEEELLKPLGECTPDNMLVLTTITVPKEIEKMTVNLKAPVIINASERRGCQIIIEGDEYQVRYPVYEILRKKGGD
ncbi:flagellar assembly protein FliW [bacterium C-53]|nr:flagellar assembly protein FliW [Lachnospiraceae bacterium]NBI02887.1 flagellar assembly protein FliW [Lachnospiraceae bacterium]RKJ11011.1 flagellar assembly protein FliW [bacterium C-53]